MLDGRSLDDDLRSVAASLVIRLYYPHARWLCTKKGIAQITLSLGTRSTSQNRMKSYREELTFETKDPRAYININATSRRGVEKSGVKEGLCLVKTLGTSARAYIFNMTSGGCHKIMAVEAVFLE